LSAFSARSCSLPTFVANDRQLLTLLVQGTHIAEITRTAGWRSRQVHTFAARQGYLFGPDGVPYRPVSGRGRRSAG
jgi:hypothetical protein